MDAQIVVEVAAWESGMIFHSRSVCRLLDNIFQSQCGGVERSMHDELARPLLPAVQRLKDAGVAVGLVYGQDDLPVPYSPIHSKYCVIDDYIVIDGSFNWYNTSVFSHDQIVVAASHEVAKPYLYEFDEIRRSFRVFY